MMNNSGIEIFKSEDGITQVQVKLENETVWLNLNQISELFQRDKSVISRHLNNVFKEKELERKATVAKFATVQTEGERDIKRVIEYFNLDAIISVGYRVNSKRGTQFRIWASKVLKDYLIKGFSLNEKKLVQQNEQLKELRESVKILGNVLKYKELSNNESASLLKVISDYAYALDILDQYDYQSLEIHSTSGKEIYQLTYSEAIKQIQLAKKFYGNSNLFGNEKDESFKSSLSTIYQTFDGKDLYPSVEEKAANLLYFITKNHSFTDGNKRIADNALVALTLMIAVSKPEEKEIMVKVAINLIYQKN